MLHFAGGAALTVNGDYALDVKAPDSGTYAGVAIFAARDSAGRLALTGDAGVAVAGAIYAPAGDVVYTGSAALGTGACVRIMASTVTFWGGAAAALDGGCAALEFALIMPSLAFALAVTVDLGLAYSEQMTLDHAVRAGAEFAATGVADQETLEKLVIAAAIGHAGDAPYEVRKSAPVVKVIEVCRCPGQETEVACTTTCPGLKRPSLFYSLEARKTYDALFFADRELGAAIQVQSR